MRVYSMNRFSNQPICYASIDDLRRALLIQIRRFNKACAELSATRVITLTGPSQKTAALPRVAKKGDADLERLELLQSQITLLNNMIGNLLTSFGTDEKAEEIHGQIIELRDEIRKKMAALQREIHEDAKGKISNIVKRRTGDLQRELITDFKLQENQVPASFSIGSIKLPGNDEVSVDAEIATIRLVNFKDAEGNKQPNYFIIMAFPSDHLKHMKDDLAAKPAKGLSSVYIALTPKYRIPSKVIWDYPTNNKGGGAANNSADIQKIVKALLERDGIVGVSEKRELPIDAKHIKFKHDNIIGKAVIKGNAVEVRIKDKNKMNETAADLILQLKSIIHAKNELNKDEIKFKPLPNGVIRLIFTLPGRMKGRTLSSEDRKKLRTILHLDEDEAKRVETVLENHEQD